MAKNCLAVITTMIFTFVVAQAATDKQATTDNKDPLSTHLSHHIYTLMDREMAREIARLLPQHKALNATCSIALAAGDDDFPICKDCSCYHAACQQWCGGTFESVDWSQYSCSPVQGGISASCICSFPLIQ